MILYYLLIAIQSADAYTHYTCGETKIKLPGSAIGFSVATVSFDPTSSLRLAIDDALETWNDDAIPGSALGISHGTTSISSSSNRDHINIIAYARLYDCSSASINVLGLTEIRGDSCSIFSPKEIREADIYINFCYHTWSSTSDYYDWKDENYDADLVNIQRVVVHESGHAVGLGHDSYNDETGGPLTATMNHVGGAGSLVGDGQYLDNDFYQPGENDRVGIRVLYPDSSNDGHDVAVQVYAMDPVSFEEDYCDARQVRPNPIIHDLSARAVEEGKDASDCPNDMSTPSPESGLVLAAGARLDIDYNLLNLGNSTVTSPTRIRLVSAVSPSTAVTLFSHNPELTRNSPYSLTKTVTIPPETSSGVYNIVIETDYNNNLSEIDETNNKAVWNQQVAIVGGCSCSSNPKTSTTKAVLPGLFSILVLIMRRRKEMSF